MELHSVRKTSHYGGLGEEKHQMLDLNRRLETYLSRVKLLEEENSLLAKEVQALRCSNHRASKQRKDLEEELRQARLEVEATWRDKVHRELEVGRLSQELQALDLQRQKEAQARMKVRTDVEQSRKELEEEQRAQVWLREKVKQLEHEMEHLIHTHQEDVAHMEATLAQSRTTIVPPMSSQRGYQTPNLLQMGQEYSQRANKAWQEAAEVYQAQLAKLEESLTQTRSRLTQVAQEKNENQLRLRALGQEIASAQDVRLHLEKSLGQQGHRCSEEIQQLQEHLGGLEAEREELGQQINQIVLDKRDLLQVKMSLGLEVATYRALLDGEILRGDVPMKNQPRKTSIKDAVFSPLGVKRNYLTQLSPNHKTASLSSARGVKGSEMTVVNSVWSRKPEASTETPKISLARSTATPETPYPKILQDGAVESFRPQEVQETVTYAEPLSPPNEQEDLGDTAIQGREGPVGAEVLEQRQIVESIVSRQVECVQSSEPTFNHPLEVPTDDPEPHGATDESDKGDLFKIKAEREDMKEPHAPIDAWVEKGVEHVQEETSDSGTEAVLEPNFESRTSSPVSEYEPEEGAFNNVTEFSPDEYILKEEAAEVRQETSCAVVGTNEEEVEDKLYPDGEEMDTWDSVIERKVDLKTDDDKEKNEEKRSHAEPEEDISPREQKQEKREMKDLEQEDMVTQVEDTGSVLFVQNKEEEDDDEDSQNVSVSWRTELESDSYAQDNTLADTRPLIRYKSDDTDANTQASHMDESESSEGEEKKAGETGSGMWSEDKAKKFGTMEDLCEEVEEETVDQNYEQGYFHIEDRRDEGEQTTNDPEERREVIEGNSDEETEETTEPIVPKTVDYDEELEIDRLVEQELEDLAIDSFSAHFAQKTVRQREEMQGKHPEEEEEEEKDEEEEDEYTCLRVNQELTSSSATIDQPHDNVQMCDSSAPHEEVQEHQTVQQAKEEEEEHNVSMVTHADPAEDGFGFDDFSGRAGVEDTNNSDELEEMLPAKMEDGEPQEDLSRFPGVSGEWEVLEDQGEDFGTSDQGDDFKERDDVSESETLRKEEPVESGADEGDIFVVKNPTQLLQTDSEQNDLHEFLSSGVKNDFWVSSLETGATNRPDDACNEEQTNQKLGFSDNLVWGELENPNLVNWNSRVDVAQMEQDQAKKVVCRKVVDGESEESEGEGGSWSSGEEPA